MFFYLAKIVWALLQPMAFIALLMAAALVAMALRWRRISAASLALALVLLGLSGWTTAGALLLAPLESRFARPNPMPQTIKGIIVLGGSFEGGVNLVRGGYELNTAGDRLVEAAALAVRYPEARIVVSGGNGSLTLEGEGDAVTSARFFTALGIDPSRLVLETQSRDTYENAVMSRRMVDAKDGETWLLVTSAFHMPRSMALFRSAGFDVVAWPSDYRTTGDEGFGPARDNLMDNLDNVTVGTREWLGLIAYRLSGRTSRLLPSP